MAGSLNLTQNVWAAEKLLLLLPSSTSLSDFVCYQLICLLQSDVALMKKIITVLIAFIDLHPI